MPCRWGLAFQIAFAHFSGRANSIKKHQGSVVQRVDSAIQWKNYYPLDNAINLDSTYPVDSDLSGE